MGAKRRKGARGEGNRPSTFFIVLIVVGLLALVVAFVASVKRMPGAKANEKKTAIETHLPAA